MIDRDFLSELKRATESKWRNADIDHHLSAFQFQRGTKWNPGLSAEAIAEYENALQARFPDDFRAFLAAMNGTDMPTFNVYGSSGEPHRQSVGVYSYPRDLELVKHRIEAVAQDRAEIIAELADQGFDLPQEAKLVPIYIHRFIVCESNLERSVILSIHGTDAIVYSRSLQEYLTAEFL